MNHTLKIAQLGDAVLREQAMPIDDYNCHWFRQLVADMENTMQEAKGIGISAPQVGVSSQVLIIASRPTDRYPNAPLMEPTAMINPSLEIIDSEQHKDWEGCLSIPGIRALVPRYKAIKVNYRDIQGQPRETLLNDFPARVFQHEFDHLQGMVYLDRVENNRDIIAESEFFKRLSQNESKL